MTKPNRRTFLRLTGLAGAAALSAAAAPPESLAASLIGDLKVLRRTRLQMGTVVTITAVDRSLDKSNRAVEAAFAEIDRLTAIMTRYDSAAPLAHLARTGRLNDPAPELVSVLEAAGNFHRLSHGAFDVTVAPVLDETEKTFKQTGRAPSDQRLAELHKLVDQSALGVAPNRISLAKSGMAVTLDGCAKGYIVDRAAAVLKKAGIKRALINAGGDIYALGKKSSRPWRVRVTDPTRPDQLGPVVELADQALATSGNYEVFFDSEKLHHHIVEPSLGRSPRRVVSVSIKAADCLTADAAATTVFCLKPTAATKLTGRIKADSLVIIRDGRRLAQGYWG